MVGGWRDETFFGLYYVDLYAIIPIQMGSVVWFPNIIQTTVNLPYQPLCLWSPDPFPKNNIGSIINPLTSAPCIFGQFVWVSCRRFFDFWLGDLYLTHVSECDWNMWRENTCIKKHIHHTASGIVPYSSPRSMTETVPFPPHPTGHRTRHQPFVRAGAPAVPRHKLPRYGVLSYDPPGRGHPTPCGRGDSEVWAWWWSGEWQFLVSFLGWAGLILARFF